MKKNREYQNNIKLKIAKENKNDEFYTMYEDIEKELVNYNPQLFYNKTILLPCDDFQESNFTKYFLDNFKRLKLKKLISSCYIKNGKGKVFIKEGASERNYLLEGNGDFKSEEVSAFKEEADYIITNPPFSLIRDFVEWLEDKKFLILSSMTACTAKNIFPLFQNGLIQIGKSIQCGDREYKIPNNQPILSKKFRIDENGNKFVRVSNIRWFTNIPFNSKKEPLELHTMDYNLKNNTRFINVMKNKFNASSYLKYDNFDALEIPITQAIPSDYNGLMGVPITFLDKYIPEQFEIIGTSGTLKKKFSINGKEVFKRIIIKKK